MRLCRVLSALRLGNLLSGRLEVREDGIELGLLPLGTPACRLTHVLDTKCELPSRDLRLIECLTSALGSFACPLISRTGGGETLLQAPYPVVERDTCTDGSQRGVPFRQLALQLLGKAFGPLPPSLRSSAATSSRAARINSAT